MRSRSVQERRDGVGGVGQQALVHVVLEDVRVERVVAIGRVVEARGHAGVDQRGDFGQIEAGDSVVDRRMIFRPGFPHQRRSVLGALGGIEKKSARRDCRLCRLSATDSRTSRLVVELLLRELVGIVEDHRHMLAAAHGERLPRVDVHQEVRRRFGSHRIGQAADPAVLLAAVGRGGVPVRHRREVRERGILVAAAVDDGQLAVFIEALEAGHAAAETEMIVDGADFLLAGCRDSGRCL